MSEYTLADVINSHIQANNTRTYTQLPAVVDTFYDDSNTIDVTLLVSDIIRGSNVIQAGKILRVPVLFPSGGSFKQGFKLSKGDNVLINFCMRSLDSYHLTEGKSVTIMDNKRYHDISDAFATVGAFPRKSPVVSEDFKGYSYLLDGNTSIVFNKDGEGLTITSDKDITFNCEGSSKVLVNGDLEVDGEVTVTGNIEAQDMIVPLSTNPLIPLSLRNHTHASFGSPPISP